MNPTPRLLSTTDRGRAKRHNDGSGTLNGLNGLRKHRLDRTTEDVGMLCNPLRKNYNKRLVVRSSGLKGDWLGLWKAPLRNPFNMYGTLPSRLRCRDNRKAFSVPPLTNAVGIMENDGGLVASMNSSKVTLNSTSDSVDESSVDYHEEHVRIPGSLEVQRTNTMLSDPKSSRSSMTASTTRSTIDSFRYSGSFDTMVEDDRDKQASSPYVETLMNKLFAITRNGFLSGALSDDPWKDDDELDADFFAVSLARKRNFNPGLRLFHDLEAIVSAPSRYRSMGEPCSAHVARSDSVDGLLPSMRSGGVLGRASPMECVSPLACLSPRRNSDFLRHSINDSETSEEEKLLWALSTDSACDIIRRVGLAQRPVKYDMNDDFMLTDADEYMFVDTKLGRVTYSPKFMDDRYMYRFVVLDKAAQDKVEALLHALPDNSDSKNSYISARGEKRYLTEHEIIRKLGIQMSPGWEHFMYFKNSHKEIVLRKRL
ncbi:cyclin-dependent kinase, putative [Babesia caballi]|uniref:Cyclin-dependent kinases regulatory subunit n=1 Tax=Babesia caballi TaxID=5871 RepID=A0AAV4M023_BABCB|nr:cyclin-dependent kinase, putative [Babesia caballi]